jgi:glyoxylate/hydroxypyruvate reductase A
MARMVVLLVTPRLEEADIWRRGLSELLPDVDFRVHPDVGDPAAIDVALAWRAPHGILAGLRNLRLICSLGMGVDHLLQDPTLPDGVPIARLVDPNMIEQMSEYVLYAALHFHRWFDRYERFQRERRWQELPLPHTALRRIGIMGLGEIGLDCARKTAALGFPVNGWSSSRKSILGVQSFAGMRELEAFLAQTDILVTILPLTSKTRGIVDARSLACLPRGACFVNVARGGLVVEGDLLQALDSGHLEGAMLDVVEVEPLPEQSPLWTHPKVKITPHIAGLTNPVTAVRPIADNIRRLAAGEAVLNLVDRGRGY